MEKDNLPKLELEGFTSDKKAPEPAERKTRIYEIVRRAGASRTAKESGRADKPALSDDEIKYRRLLIKTGVCAAIAVVILGIASINTPATDVVTQTVGNAVNHKFDIDEDIGRLKFVDNLNDELQSVFSPLPDEMVVYPAEGEVITTFGQAGSKGIRIMPVSTEIVSMARGTVEQTGKIDDKGYVKVKLDTGETALYYNVAPSVAINDIVKPGQQIGNLEGEYLYVEIKDGDIFVDPVVYIEKWTAPAPE
jgi:murein DD-endopeptidase MepM/ murein hydrolase activator NlpD